MHSSLLLRLSGAKVSQMGTYSLPQIGGWQTLLNWQVSRWSRG